MKLTEKVSYLQGLMDGLEIDDSTKEGKVLLQMADILQDVALSIEDMEEEIDEIADFCDTVDEDLGALEEDFYEEQCDCDDFDDDDEDDDEDFDIDDEMYEVVCPTCGDTICLDEGMIEEGSIECPNCSEFLEFDFDNVEVEEDED